MLYIKGKYYDQMVKTYIRYAKSHFLDSQHIFFFFEDGQVFGTNWPLITIPPNLFDDYISCRYQRTIFNTLTYEKASPWSVLSSNIRCKIQIL